MAITETTTSSAAGQQRVFSLPERWQLERVLGTGGQGEVWLAFDKELNEHVAIKVLARPESPTASERLKREVRIGRKLRHQNLVQIYELIDAGASMAIVMEYLDGGSLAERLAAKPLSIPEIERIAEALLGVLICLHNEGIVHRDVKPSNVLFGDGDVPKLADLGTLRPLNENNDLTGTNLTVGTPAYMSPEQVAGSEPAPSSDLYSLGVTLFELLTRKRPFEGRSGFDVARMHMMDEASPVRRKRPDCPRWLAGFVHRLLEKDPQKRWPDATKALETFNSRRWRPTQRSIVRSIAIIAIVATIGAISLAGVDRMAEIRPSSKNGKMVVKNALGRTLWNKTIDGLQPYAAALDLSPGGGQEILTGIIEGPPEKRQLKLRVFGQNGETLRDFTVTSDYNAPQFPGMSENLFLSGLEIMDLGPDLGKTAVWRAGDTSWYPGIAGYWSEGGNPVRIFVNSGHIRDEALIDVNNDGNSEILLTGINNELGFQAFVAIYDPSGIFSRSPDLNGPEEASNPASGLMGYALLGEVDETRISAHAGPSKDNPPILIVGGRQIPITPDGAIDGLSLVSLNSFWADTIETAAKIQNNEIQWDLEVQQLNLRQEAIWSRPAYRAGAAFILAKALAKAGNPQAGALVLENTEPPELRLRRVKRRIGEMHLLAGDHLKGRAALIEAIDSIGQGFGPLDEVLDLGLYDALTQNPATWSHTKTLLGSYQFNQYQRALEVVVNFYGGRFPSCQLSLEIHPGALFSAFVLQHWATIENGRGDAATLGQLLLLEQRAECEALATLALARFEVLNGQPADAAARAGEAFWQIRERALSSWPEAVYLPLAQWAYATVLEATGDAAEAQTLFQLAAASAPETFFGQDAAKR